MKLVGQAAAGNAGERGPTVSLSPPRIPAPRSALVGSKVMRVLLDLLDRCEQDAAAMTESEFEGIPRRVDEFVCSKCHLVHHHSKLRGDARALICADCASDLRTK